MHLTSEDERKNRTNSNKLSDSNFLYWNLVLLIEYWAK